eukprot:gene25893-33846_t
MNPQYKTNINSKGAILDTIRSLQKGSNGFDLRGIIQYETISDREGPILSEQSAFWIGLGFAKLLQRRSREEGKEEENALTVGIGCDSRLSGFQLTDWLAGGLRTGGIAKVTNVGLCTTPAMYYACCPSESFRAHHNHTHLTVSVKNRLVVILEEREANEAFEDELDEIGEAENDSDGLGDPDGGDDPENLKI